MHRWCFLWLPALAFLVAMQGTAADCRGDLFYLRLGPLETGTREIEAYLTPLSTDDPTQLAEYSHTRLVVLTEDGKSQNVNLHYDKEQLTAKVRLGEQGVVVRGECILGVVTREAPILERYYPKTVAGQPAQLNKIQAVAPSGIDIVPFFGESDVTFAVYEDGKAIAEAELVIVDPQSHDRGTAHDTRLVTNSEGKATWTPPGDGTFTVFLRRESMTAGKYGGQSYEAVQNIASLTLTFPLVDTGTEALLHKVKQATIQNLMGPLVLFFFLGFIAKLIKSDLRFPPEGYQLLVIFLLLSIGYEGGHQLRGEPNLLACILPLGAGFVLNTMIAITAILTLRKVMGFDTPNACALGALYGSDSATLYAVALALVRSFHLPSEGFMPAMLATMEIPGVLVGVVMYKLWTQKPAGAAGGHGDSHQSLLGILFHELKSPGVYMLVGGMLVGYFTLNSEYLRTEAFFIEPFKGVMCLFLFENGLKAGEQINTLKKGVLKLVIFGTLFPLTAGIVAIFIARMLGLSIGSAVLFAALAAGPSNIAAPAAMRLAIPEANPSIYFTTSLGISFPTLVVAGVPIFYLVAQMAYAY